MRSTHNRERVLLGGSTGSGGISRGTSGSGGTSRGRSGSGGTIRGTSWKWRVSDDCYLHLHQHVALCSLFIPSLLQQHVLPQISTDTIF